MPGIAPVLATKIISDHFNSSAPKAAEKAMAADLKKSVKTHPAKKSEIQATETGLRQSPLAVLHTPASVLAKIQRPHLGAAKHKAQAELTRLHEKLEDRTSEFKSNLNAFAREISLSSNQSLKTAFANFYNALKASREQKSAQAPESLLRQEDWLKELEGKMDAALAESGAKSMANPSASYAHLTMNANWKQLIKSKDAESNTYRQVNEMTTAYQTLRHFGHLNRHWSYSWASDRIGKRYLTGTMGVLNAFGMLTMVASTPLMYLSFKQMFDMGHEGQPQNEAPPANYGAQPQSSGQSLSA